MIGELVFPYVCSGCGRQYAQMVGFCWDCMRAGSVFPASVRGADLVLPNPRTVYSANVFASLTQTKFTSSSYPMIRFSRGNLVLVWGSRNNGKSTLVTRLGQGLRPTLLLAMEEKLGPTLADRLVRLECRHLDFYVAEPQTVDELMQEVDRIDPVCLICDSFPYCSLTGRDWLKIARSRSGIVVLVQQENKAGQIAGTAELAHLADVVIRVDNMRFKLEKSRNQEALVEGSVL